MKASNKEELVAAAVSAGVFPESLNRIQHLGCVDFLSKCFQPSAQLRPSAMQLLAHPFLAEGGAEDDEDIAVRMGGGLSGHESGSSGTATPITSRSRSNTHSHLVPPVPLPITVPLTVEAEASSAPVAQNSVIDTSIQPTSSNPTTSLTLTPVPAPVSAPTALQDSPRSNAVSSINSCSASLIPGSSTEYQCRLTFRQDGSSDLVAVEFCFDTSRDDYQVRIRKYLKL